LKSVFHLNVPENKQEIVFEIKEFLLEIQAV